MAVPDYGAAPLAKFFLMVRILSLIAMVCIVGITANFASEIVSTNIEPPREVVATLAITCIAAFYCLISIPLFYARAHLGLLIMTAVDSGLLLSFIIVAVCFGRPLSYLNCSTIASASSAANAQSAANFVHSLQSNMNVSGARLGLNSWAGSTKMNCYQTKAIWGMCIGLCILFASSVMVLPTLFFKSRKAGGAKSAV